MIPGNETGTGMAAVRFRKSRERNVVGARRYPWHGSCYIAHAKETSVLTLQ